MISVLSKHMLCCAQPTIKFFHHLGLRLYSEASARAYEIATPVHDVCFGREGFAVTCKAGQESVKLGPFVVTLGQ